jgi:flagellar protein FlaJ
VDEDTRLDELIDADADDTRQHTEDHLDDELEPDTEAALTDPVVADLAPNRFKSSLLGEGYGWLRAFFKRHPDRYRRLQRRLNQARVPLTHDQYLARSARRALLVTVLAAVTVLVLTVLSGVASISVFDLYRNGVGAVARLDGRSLALLAGLPAGAGITSGGVTWLWRTRIRPQQLVAARRRKINLILPYTVTFLYALTDAGSDLLIAIRTVSNAGSVYGEVSEEFDRVVREMDLFGNDLWTALRNTARVSPSEEFENFVDDLLSVLSAGGNVDQFLEEEVDDRLETAEEEQAAFVETLALLSEGFVVGFVAAPLFLIVTLVVVSFIGAETLDILTAVIYLVFPVGIVLYILLIDVLSGPFVEPPVDLDTDRGSANMIDEAVLADDPRFTQLRKQQRRQRLRNTVGRTIDAVKGYPPWAFVVTVPVACAVIASVIWTGYVDPSVPAVIADPFRVTVALAVVPVLIATIPVSLLHERQARREQQIVARFPDLLELLANTNKMGIEVTDSVRTVSQWASGELGTELKRRTRVRTPE